MLAQQRILRFYADKSKIRSFIFNVNGIGPFKIQTFITHYLFDININKNWNMDWS